MTLAEEELDQIVGLQFKGVHYFLSAFVRAMTKWRFADADFIGDNAVHHPRSCRLYRHQVGCRRAGIRCVANQYGPQGIRANTVSPGFTESPMTSASFATPGVADAFIKEYPLGRVGTVEDIAQAVLWLADDATFVSGQNLQINGGLTLAPQPAPRRNRRFGCGCDGG